MDGWPLEGVRAVTTCQNCTLRLCSHQTIIFYLWKDRGQLGKKKIMCKEKLFGFLNGRGVGGTYLRSLTLKPKLGCHSHRSVILGLNVL